MKKRFILIMMLGLLFTPAALAAELSGRSLRESTAFNGVKCAGMASSDKRIRDSSDARSEVRPVVDSSARKAQ